jgi:hypothetical protein
MFNFGVQVFWRCLFLVKIHLTITHLKTNILCLLTVFMVLRLFIATVTSILIKLFGNVFKMCYINNTACGLTHGPL